MFILNFNISFLIKSIFFLMSKNGLIKQNKIFLVEKTYLMNIS